MLSESEMHSNKARFTQLIQSVDREGFQKDNFLQMLDFGGFFQAPCSTRYHNSYPGGLCEHSLHVYDILEFLDNEAVRKHDYDLPFDRNSKILVALCHDIEKCSKYVKSVYNKKVYTPDGDKCDELGRFTWKSMKRYELADMEQRFVFGMHGVNSEKLLAGYCPLTYDESCAIINHHSVYDNPSMGLIITEIYNRFTLAALLHCADMLATYVKERYSE